MFFPACHITYNALLFNRFTEAFLSAYMSYQTDNYWIGLSDTQTQGTYTWISGVPVTYTNWVAAHTGIVL